MRRAAVLACAIAIALPSAGAAQPGVARIAAGGMYQSYFFSSDDDIGIESLALLTLPAGARVSITRAVALEVSSAWASGILTRPDGSESTIDGPTDTELRLEVGLGRDLVTITGIALLPTGSESVSFEEADVAGAIAADILPFSISNWGTGGGFGIATSITRPIGSFAAGISVGYVVAREFEPLADETFTYRPGNQLHITAALDRTFGDAGKAALVVSAQHFADDEIDGGNLFSSGDRLQATGSYAFAAGARGNGIVYAGWLHREAGGYADERLVLPAQDLAFGGAGFELPAGSMLIRPSADIRVQRSDDGTGQGYTVGVGGSVDVPAGLLTVVPTVRGRFGNVTLRQQAESGFTGFEAGLTIRFGARAR